MPQLKVTPFLDSGKKSAALLTGVVILMILSASLAYFRFAPLKMLPFDNKNEFQVVIDMPEGTTLEYEPLRREALWGIGRLAQVYPEMLIELEAAKYIRPYLESDDESSRSLSAWALRMLGMERPVF